MRRCVFEPNVDVTHVDRCALSSLSDGSASGSADAETDTVIFMLPGRYSGQRSTDLSFCASGNCDSVSKRVSLVSLAGSRYTILDSAGTARVARFENVPLGTVIDGVTITGGSAEQGGALMMTDSSPAFDNCIFTGNSAPHGGVIYALRSEPLIMSSTFVANGALQSGGAIYAKQSRPQVRGTVLWSNGSKTLDPPSTPCTNSDSPFNPPPRARWGPNPKPFSGLATL